MITRQKAKRTFEAFLASGFGVGAGAAVIVEAENILAHAKPSDIIVDGAITGVLTAAAFVSAIKAVRKGEPEKSVALKIKREEF